MSAHEPGCWCWSDPAKCTVHRPRPTPPPILVTEGRCRDERHFWPDDSHEGDTCECGQWYRFSDRIEAAPYQSESSTVGMSTEIQRLPEQWRKEARDFRTRQYNGPAWRAMAVESERRADQLEAVLKVALSVERQDLTGGDCPRCGFKLERWPA